MVDQNQNRSNHQRHKHGSLHNALLQCVFDFESVRHAHVFSIALLDNGSFDLRSDVKPPITNVAVLVKTPVNEKTYTKNATSREKPILSLPC